jgi:hypothetical protein
VYCTVVDCVKDVQAKGLCMMHYKRKQRTGSVGAAAPGYRPTILERFHSKYVVNNNGCWIWQDHLSGLGYGVLFFGAQRMRAHRWSYEHFVGPIPDDFTIDHLCKTPACVNPDHLEPVTREENTRRAWRQRKTP